MKIVCDNCATKYSIADEKVRGKVFKIRCKKCSHIIVVRGGEGAAAAHEPAHGKADDAFPGDDPATVAQSRPPAAAAGLGTGEAVWHLVIDREQIGPLTAEEVRGKFAAREIDVETYGWREGFADWLRLGSIDDFRDLGETQVPGPSIHEGATRRTDTADLFATAGVPSGGDDAPAAASSGDLFAGQNAPGAPTAETSMPANDLFSGGGGSAALFSAPQAAAGPASRGRTASPGFGIQAPNPSEQAGAPPAEGGKLMGQRNESSVLFSLNNLQALASGGGSAPASAPKESRPGFASSQSEGSGLIDIRAMAASTLAASPASPVAKNDEPPSFAATPLFSPMAAPILMPSQASGPPKWIWALLGIGVLAVLGIVVVGVLLLTKKPEIAPVAVNTALPPAVAANPAAPPTAANPAAPPTAANPAAPPTAATPEAAAADDKGKKKSSGSKSSKSRESGSAPAAAAAAAPTAPAPAAAKPKPGKRDELDDLLNTAAPDKPAPKHTAPREEAPSGGGGKEQLEKSDIVGGMSKIKGRVQGCYNQFKVPGLANVSVTIGKSGRVSSANVSGSFSGTPTGNCVESAVKSASFPSFTGSPQTINYPFMLR